MNDGGIKKIISIFMKGWPLIIFALVLNNQTANAQQAKAASRYSELTEWALRGNIKTETLLVFEQSAVSDAKILAVDTSQWMRKVVVHYDRQGNTEKMETVNRSADGYDTTITVYNYKDLERTGTSTEKGETTGTTKKY